MRRIAVIVLALLLATDLWAGDPWKDKSYKNWDERDVRKILNDSPWAKRIELERDEKKHGLEAPEGAPTSGVAPGVDQEDEQEEKGAGHEREDDDDRGKEKVKFVVRWVSSRTLREASVRGQVLRKRISETDADKYMPPPPQDYEVAVVGTDMRPFQNADEATVRDKTYLVTGKSKERTSPSQVEVVRGPDGKRINAVVFHFPKKNSAGQATIPADEKELKFVSREGAIEIKASFDPHKMIDQQGMDL